MIQILFARYFLTVAAVTVNDNKDVHIAFGLTERHAERKLMKSLDEYDKH